MAANMETDTRIPFTVMAKPVGSRCNLRCEYCYYLEKDSLNPEHSLCMSDELLECYIKSYIQASPGPAVQFTWHGGEPTLAGLDFYKKAILLQKKYLPEGWSCWNNIQTNGILLNDEWCEFLSKEHFDVGLSIDGAGWIHDKYRKDPSGNGSFDRVLATVKRLKSYGINPDLLCTVTSDSAAEPQAVYRSLRDMDTGWMQFIPIVRYLPDGSITQDSVTPEAYGKFLCDIFDDWLFHDIGKVDVQLIAETAKVWAGGEAQLCWMSKTCGCVLIVERDGSIYSCDHFVDDEHRIGNIFTSDLGELLALPEQRNFGNLKRDALTSKCKSCNWLSVCNGGCPKDRTSLTDDGESGQYLLCEGLRMFFEHAEKPLKRVMSLSSRRTPPGKISEIFREEEREKWKGIGRNDPCPCGSGKKAKNCCWNRRP